MSLAVLCRDLSSTIAQLEAARRGVSDGAAIDERRSQWSAKLARLQGARERASWLGLEPAVIPDYVGQFQRVRELAAEAIARLEDRADVAALTGDDLWVRLLQSADGAAENLWQAVKERWAQAAARLQELTPPNQLRITASPLPENERLLLVYEANFRQAGRLAGQEFPRTADDPGALDAAIAACKEAAAGLRFDAPADVEAFFRALNAHSAHLGLVTGAVLDWLAENGELQSYVVRRAGR
jgi:hypothetical protein